MTKAEDLLLACTILLCAFATPGRSVEFNGICEEIPCSLNLNRDSISSGNIVIPLKQVTSWLSEDSRESGSTQRGLKTARGALIGGVIGAAFLGPVGATVGGLWAGSEESSGNPAPDMAFTITGYDETGNSTVIRIRFNNPDVARRFRLQLPMFTGLTSGERRTQ